MACQMAIPQPQFFPRGRTPFLKNPGVRVLGVCGRMSGMRLKTAGVVRATATEKPSKRRSGEEAKGFVEEMRAVAMKLHTRDQAKEGEKEPEGRPVARWEPTVEGYLRFLVDSKLVYDALEFIVSEADCPWSNLMKTKPLLLSVCQFGEFIEEEKVGCRSHVRKMTRELAACSRGRSSAATRGRNKKRLTAKAKEE